MRHPLLAITTVAVAWLPCSHARAEIIHFVNPPEGEPGHFPWQWQYYEDDQSPLNWLDITRPSTDQGELVGPNSVGQIRTGGHVEPQNATLGGALVAQIDGTSQTKALVFGEFVQGHQFAVDSLHVGIDQEGDYYSDFPIGERAYIGVMTGSGNFGWIEVERFFNTPGELKAFAWAYETIPGKPIYAGEIPAPGTVALLMVGAVGLKQRRRRA